MRNTKCSNNMDDVKKPEAMEGSVEYIEYTFRWRQSIYMCADVTPKGATIITASQITGRSESNWIWLCLARWHKNSMLLKSNINQMTSVMAFVPRQKVIYYILKAALTCSLLPFKWQ